MLHNLSKVVIMISLPVDLGEHYVIVCAYQLNHCEKKIFFLFLGQGKRNDPEGVECEQLSLVYQCLPAGQSNTTLTLWGSKPFAARRAHSATALLNFLNSFRRKLVVVGGVSPYPLLPCEGG